MSRQIAIVEDEAAIRHNYEDAFRRNGYAVKAYADRSSAMAAFNQSLPDCVVIDINLGDEFEGGFDLCRELRATAADLPIIFLTARDNELDAISGLRLGADDYLTKDISIPHLMARIAALFRRSDALRKAVVAEEIIQRGRLTLDTERMTVAWDDQLVPLTVTEFWLVHALSKYPGHVKNRQQLMDAANVVLDDNTITSHIKRLRRKFRVLDDQFDAIETVYGMGYRWQGAEA
ncbi:MAG: proteobacterial dedicated sortase system response regulator [Gammaproteobacteria bacterium]|nr:proteobacterial dedicated sortase system response regulator [Gammaproteobacteria bacterium]